MYLTPIFMLFYCLLSGTPSREYFFSDEIAKLEFDTLGDVLKKIHKPTNCLVVDNKKTWEPKDVIFITINLYNWEFRIDHYEMKGEELENMIYEYDLKAYREDLNMGSLVVELCYRIRNLIKDRVFDVYYIFCLETEDHFEYNEKVKNFNEKFNPLLKTNLPKVDVVECLNIAVFEYLFYKKKSDPDKLCFMNLQTDVNNLDVHSYIHRCCVIRHIKKIFTKHLISLERKQIRELTIKYKDYILYEEMIRTDDKSEVKNELYLKHRTNLYYLYVFHMLKKNNRFTEDIVRKHLWFFNSLMNFIVTKEGFNNNFDSFFLKCELDEKEKFIKSFNDLIISTGLPFKTLSTSDDLECKIRKFILGFCNESPEYDSSEFISMFFTIFLKDFDFVAKITFSRNFQYSENVEKLRDKLISKSNANLKHLIRGFIDFYTARKELYSFSEYEQNLFLKLQDICKEQVEATLSKKGGLPPKIFEIINNFY